MWGPLGCTGPFRTYGALYGVWGLLGCTGPFRVYGTLNPLNTGLNPIRHLLALLEVHCILHVSSIWIKNLQIFVYVKAVQTFKQSRKLLWPRCCG